MDYKIQDGFFKNLGLGVGAYYESNTTTYTSYAYTLPAYFTADGTVYYTFKNIRLGLNVNNITNTEYYSSSVPNFDSPNAFPPLLVTPAMGRNYKISIGYKF
jgi:outer membrane receptor protein involved in Fe transport